MKKIVLAIALMLSGSVYALDDYSVADDNVKSLIKNVVKVLDAPGALETEKKIFNTIDFVFEGSNWNSYWLGYNDLSSSKIKDPNVTFIEQFVNTSNDGMYFLTFMYDKKANQILISRKQFRSGVKGDALEVFKERKNDAEKYKVSHEKDNYAMLQEKGKVSFSAFNIGTQSGSVIYFNQTVIDL